MSGSRWVITPLWLSGSLRSSLYSSVYSYYVFLVSTASVRSIPFLSFTVPIFAWDVLLLSLIFLKRSLVFPILLFSSISLQWSLRKAFLSLLTVLWNSAFRWVYLSFSPLSLTSLFSPPLQHFYLPYNISSTGVYYSSHRYSYIWTNFSCCPKSFHRFSYFLLKTPKLYFFFFFLSLVVVLRLLPAVSLSMWALVFAA